MAEIILTPAARARLASLFPHRERTYIWRALHYKIASPDAIRIRHLAMTELGGIIT